MTDRNVSRPGFTAGFDFARRLADRGFREHLAELGYRAGQGVVMAVDDEPVRSVFLRIMENGTPSPCLIAIPCDTEPLGFRFLFAVIGRARRRWLVSKRVPPLPIGPGASIGMLYEALHPCGEFVPIEWAQPVVFRKILAAP